jgi:hypothetical protein
MISSLCFGQHLVRFRSWIQPQFIATPGRDVRQHFQQHRRRKIDADHLRAFRNPCDAAVAGQPLNFGLPGIHRIDGVSLLLEGADRLVAELLPVGRSTEDRNRLHEVSIVAGTARRKRPARSNPATAPRDHDAQLIRDTATATPDTPPQSTWTGPDNAPR